MSYTQLGTSPTPVPMPSSTPDWRLVLGWGVLLVVVYKATSSGLTRWT